MGGKNKIGSIFSRDKFDMDFRSALKRRSLTVVSRSDNDIYEITDGTSAFKIDAKKARKIYEKNNSQKDLENFIRGVEKECDMENRMVSFTNGQEFLRFIVMRSCDVNEDMISADFVDGLKKVVVYTSDDTNLHFIDDACMKRWAVPREVLFSVADRNMCKLLSRAEVEKSEVAPGIMALEFNMKSKKLLASLMMCNDFRRTVYKHMGSKFLVVAPSENNLLVLENITNNILEGLGNVIVKEYTKSKHPLTTDVMLFTPDDIQIAGRFSVNDELTPETAGRSLD